MVVDDIRKKRGLSMYELAEYSGVPYATVHAICKGNADIEKCQAGTVSKLAGVLRVSTDSLLEAEKAQPFTFFRCAECHKVKSQGALTYLENALVQDEISAYYSEKEYAKALYVLSMIDYLSRLNDIPLCKKYNSLRGIKLASPLYASGVLLSDALENTDRHKRESAAAAIPEFKLHNIIEAEVL